MTLLSHLIRFVPLLQAALAAAGVIHFAAEPGLASFAALLAILYLVPVAAFRVHEAFLPLEEGIEVMSEAGRYSRWWGSFQFQSFYYAIPQLEALLRLVPGLYSAWLRLWGAKVGRGVYWSPNVEVLDRSLIEIGDGVVFGHRSALVSHVAAPKRGRLIVYVKKVRIGSGAFIGALSGIGPGARVADGALLPVGSQVMVNAHPSSVTLTPEIQADA